ncbi:type II toxin-antitoxin system RelE/ParE family toxin [Pseudomonas putida]
MEAFRRTRPLYWVGSSKKDLQTLPGDVQDIFGFALHQAQEGGRHIQTKCLKGFTGAGVLEVVEDHDSNTYRAIYTVSFGSAIYVLHCFQKKSSTGVKTAKHDMDLVRSRLKLAEAHAKGKKYD